MAMSDPISDLLTRIRNAQSARTRTISCPTSKVRNAILDVLKAQGYITDFEVTDGENGQKQVNIHLKYSPAGDPVIRKISRVSRPGERRYSGVAEIKPVYNGLGIAILSTTKGVMTDHEARAAHVGGEVLAEVF